MLVRDGHWNLQAQLEARCTLAPPFGNLVRGGQPVRGGVDLAPTELCLVR